MNDKVIIVIFFFIIIIFNTFLPFEIEYIQFLYIYILIIVHFIIFQTCVVVKNFYRFCYNHCMYIFLITSCRNITKPIFTYIIHVITTIRTNCFLFFFCFKYTLYGYRFFIQWFLCRYKECIFRFTDIFGFNRVSICLCIRYTRPNISVHYYNTIYFTYCCNFCDKFTTVFCIYFMQLFRCHFYHFIYHLQYMVTGGRVWITKTYTYSIIFHAFYCLFYSHCLCAFSHTIVSLDGNMYST
ncbi:pA240L [African swine fever virus]|uniref:PA240L n=1 Tax=African swine fever virus TaxID=10497 RepID=A0A8A1UDF4_ASF|nr:pA240L [African swine fever virus]